MIELPEAHTLAVQLNAAAQGKRIAAVTAAASPHKWAWYFGDPQAYPARLCGKTVAAACAWGGFIEVVVEDVVLLIAEGAGLRLYRAGEQRPTKHQLLLEFADGEALVGSVQMYGGLWCFPAGAFDNPYYQAAKTKPSPLSQAFDARYFADLFDGPATHKLNAKAFLATEQRIPGLGNGVLQDILFAARIHPKRKVVTLTPSERDALFGAVKATLAAMTDQGGRDTETDLFGNPGGYRTKLSRYTMDRPCPDCGSLIRKETFMGGAIYVCPLCQQM